MFPMESLNDYFKEVYERGNLQGLGFLDPLYILNGGSLSFDDLIVHDKWCLEIIRTNLDFRSKRFQLESNYAYRFRHIVVCWLLGVGLGSQLIPNFDRDMIRQRAWQLSAYIHDYGYYCDEVFDEPNPSLLQTFGDHYLLKDTYNTEFLKSLNNFTQRSPNVTPYSYSEIEDYYSSDLIRRKEEGGSEKSDHGIVGGCIAFSEYADYLEQRSFLKDGIGLLELNKTACLIAASHNIWGRAPIKKECKLLLLMALVDTIELIKRFYDTDRTGRQYPLLNWKDVLKEFYLSIQPGWIVVDLTKIRDRIDSITGVRHNKLEKAFNKYVKNLKGLTDWIGCPTSENNNIITIDIYSIAC